MRLRARRPQLMAAAARVAALLVAAATCGCGGDAPPAAEPGTGAPPAADATTPGPLDACAVVTRDQVAEVLGTTPGDAIVGMTEPGDQTLAQVSQCTWPAQDSDRTLSILIRRAPTDQNTPAAIEQVRETLRSAGLTLRDTDGPGDVSFWTGSELHVFRGQREYVIIQLGGFEDPQAALAGARRAAEHILARL
jgi:hypothetical protein